MKKWCVAMILILKMLEQEIREFKTSLGYVMKTLSQQTKERERKQNKSSAKTRVTELTSETPFKNLTLVVYYAHVCLYVCAYAGVCVRMCMYVRMDFCVLCSHVWRTTIFIYYLSLSNL